MSRRAVFWTVVATVVLIAVAVWWFWPREEPEIVVTWQGEPTFTQKIR